MTELTESDPLDGAAIGETRTVTRSKTISGIDLEPPEFWGSDRLSDVDIVDLEVVSDEHDDDTDDIRVTWEADLTKRLPRRWDQCNEPRTAAERRTARRASLLRRVGVALGLITPVAFAGVVGTWLTLQVFDGSTTINGESVTATPFDLVLSLVIVSVAAGIIMWAANRTPAPSGGGRA